MYFYAGAVYHENFDLKNVVTPVNVPVLRRLLEETHYDTNKTQFLLEGFSSGFDLGYRGNRLIRRTAKNLRFTTGSEIELWNKVMKEVKAKRYAGPLRKYLLTIISNLQLV